LFHWNDWDRERLCIKPIWCAPNAPSNEAPRLGADVQLTTFIDAQLKGIIGIEIEIAGIDRRWKVSHNAGK
jgi:predicted FMN-binding regulatory protein PaiB